MGRLSSADIDELVVGHARVRIIESWNDMTTVMNDVAKALGTLHTNRIDVSDIWRVER